MKKNKHWLIDGFEKINEKKRELDEKVQRQNGVKFAGDHIEYAHIWLEKFKLKERFFSDTDRPYYPCPIKLKHNIIQTGIEQK